MAVNGGAEETAATDVTKETAAADVNEKKAAVDDTNKSAVIAVTGKSAASTCGTGGLGKGKSGGGDGVGGAAKGKSGGLEGGGGVQVRRSGGGDGGVEERGRVQRCEHPVEESTAVVRMGAVSADVAEHASAAAEAESVKSEKKLRAGLTHPSVLLSGGGTPAARRRQRRTEAKLAAVQHILVGELRERQQERARVLRAMAQRSIGRVQQQQVAVETRRQEVCSVIDAVKKLEVAVMQASLPLQPTSYGRGDKLVTRSQEKQPAQKQEVATSRPRADTLEAEWLACERQWLDELPVVLAEEGTLAEMRAARKRAVKAVKKYKVARRAYRLQRRRQQEEQRKAVGVELQQTKVKKRSRQKKGGYAYAMQGNYGDVELVSEDGGKTRREAQLRAAGAGEPSCLPTALLVFTRRHTQEVRLDSCAQYSVAGCELRKFGRCLTRDAPIDVVVGFGCGRSKVLGVWRFLGSTQYQQRVTIDALVVEGQGSEFLVGEDWMVERQAKMDFGARELKYRDSDGRKVILPFTCHGVTTLQQAGEQRQATVRLAKTIKLATNTQSVVRVTVDAADGTTGIFVPKASSKRHLLMAPTLDTVQDGMVRVAVLNIEGRREKLPARAALGTWVPTEDTMKFLEVNGELERARVAKWVSTLRMEDAAPLTNEASLQIGDMEPNDKDLFIALLRQYAEIIEKKEGCPPLAKVNVQHHINTGDAAPIMLRRRRHAVSENAIIDKEVDDMLRDEVIEEGEGAWGFPVVLVRKKDGKWMKHSKRLE
ncbi:hypothetical protein PF002_g26225 [Phytophthora fragariae]|uniref:Reverse transcriptase domain-containing protein n=1 Tax=Phytophthora fragariae TaxID=53985 RepID=A0A6A3WNI2_9STRA|nr:hypothetical protein PF004_g29099 [Phytophthora fragariae]KAE9185237.1 hypothetical protein PF002_g26225 [Phytophthora fragariae]